MTGLLGRFWRDDSAAIAPTLAIILFVLVAAGGIAFDYSRLATLDSELQNAADQAALAAAGQLDQTLGARGRATSAAQNLVSNLTYFANDEDTDGTSIRIVQVEFYSTYNRDRANLSDAPGNVASGDDDARFVRVTVETRRANFAFTPVVAAFGSNATAHALAGLGSAYCNVPPFMMCQPTPTFDPDDHIGHGLRLVTGSTNTPGNFGFLQTGFGSGAANLGRAIGYNNSFGGCVAQENLTTEPGNNQSVRAAINTRFDISDGGQACPDLPTGGNGTCSPSTNVRKDLVRGNGCSTNGNQAWRETDRPYRAPNTTPLDPATNPMIAAAGGNPAIPYPDIMGHPRDLCHAVSEAGSCTGGRVGDGVWDRNAYFHVNYGWDAAGSGTANDWTTRTGLSSGASRYQVYLWEVANTLPNGAGQPGLGTIQTVQVAQGGQGQVNKTAHGEPICRPPGVAPSSGFDRRRITVAVVSCPDPRDPAGRDVVTPSGWMDVFLVEPSFARPGRTDNGDIYVEVVGSTTMPGMGGSGPIFRRDVPQLLE